MNDEADLQLTNPDTASKIAADICGMDEIRKHVKSADDLCAIHGAIQVAVDAALARLVVEKERAERERDNWKAHAISRGKRLRQIRNKFINICDDIEDEGDRVYFGSSNDADQFKEEVTWLDDFSWDKIMGEPEDWNLLGVLEKQKDHNAALTGRLRSVCEALEPFAKEGDQWDRGNDGDFPLIKSDEYGVEAVEAEFTVGDLRRARAALDAAKKEMGE